MASITTKQRISVPRSEYEHLKKMEARFRNFFDYLDNLFDIREARKQVKQKRVISQERLFRKIGF